MTTIVRSIDVNVPVRTVYNQWIRFHDFPKFMEGVKQVTQIDPKRLHWIAECAGQENEWVAKIVEQTLDKRIAWMSREGALHGAIVTIHPLSEAQSKILLRVMRIAGRVVNNVEDALDALSLRMQGDLERFKALIEAQGHETGASGTRVEAAVTCSSIRRRLQASLLGGRGAPIMETGAYHGENTMREPSMYL